VHLVDQPSVHTPGVSFLQLPANRRRVAGWQSQMLATGVLDDAACPVRPAFKPPVADADDDGGGADQELWNQAFFVALGYIPHPRHALWIDYWTKTTIRNRLLLGRTE